MHSTPLTLAGPTLAAGSPSVDVQTTAGRGSDGSAVDPVIHEFD